MIAPSSSAATSAWTTALSETTPESISIRGYEIAELIGTVPFPAVVYLLFTGELPDPAAARLIDAVMVASIDHGAGAPSALAARTAISGGATLQAGTAAGLLALGEFHGAAVESSMEAIGAVVEAGRQAGEPSLAHAADRLVATWRDEGRRVPGFGHRQHRRRDPRLDRLLDLVGEAGLAGDHVAAALAIETSLHKAVGRPVPINIDGVIAAVLGEIGFPSELGNAVFIASRLAGVLAHANEERQTMAPMRRVDPSNHTYCGPAARSLATTDGATADAHGGNS